jgi:hypothetical protein
MWSSETCVIRLGRDNGRQRGGKLEDLERRLARMAEGLELADERISALQVLCEVLISHLDPLEKQRLGQRRIALRRRLDAERPRPGEGYPDQSYRVLNLMDGVLEQGLGHDADAPIDTE